MAREKLKIARQPRHGDRRAAPVVSPDESRISSLVSARADRRIMALPLSMRALSLVFATVVSTLMWLALIYAGTRLVALFG